MNSYSQFGQDRAVAEVFPAGYRGIFVDVGAGDGVTDSNTLAFEEEGWHGLLVEAEHGEAYAARTRRQAPVENVACFNESGLHLFVHSGVKGWGGLFGTHRQLNEEEQRRHQEAAGGGLGYVDCLPLSELLRRHDLYEVDYLSLDVEGAELSVLESANWLVTDIKVLTVEVNDQAEAIRQFLLERGYCLWDVIGVDEMYVQKKWLRRWPR